MLTKSPPAPARYAFDAARTPNVLGFRPYIIDHDLQNDIHEFFAAIAHVSVKDSYTDAGLGLILDSFEKLLKKQNCINALHSLQILKREKSGDEAFRANGKTPNILHEIRNCAQALGMVAMGYLPMDIYKSHGGLDADMTTRLRHDSIEDSAKSKIDIYAGLERNLHMLVTGGYIDDDFHYDKRREATIAANNIDLMTRKEAIIDDETGVIKRSKKGKLKKRERYGGNTNTYWYKLLESPLALLCKYADRTENVGTRFGVKRFTVSKNIKYARETREIYGTEDFDDRAVQKWPAFEPAIRAADDMLGVNLTILEGVNKYMDNPALNPVDGVPFRMAKYLPNALLAFQLVPDCLHPIAVAIDGLEEAYEDDPRMETIVNNLVLPPIQEAIRDYRINPIPSIPRLPHVMHDQASFDFDR